MLHGGRHAIRGITALFTLLALLLAPVSTATAAEPTQLQATAELNGNGSRISVRGTLTTADEPVDDARIEVRLDQTSLGTTGTNRRGEFQLNAPLPGGTAGGSHVVTVSFDGDDDLDPSSTTITVEIPGGQDPDDDPATPDPSPPVEPTPTTPPPDTRPNATVTLSVDPVDPRPGELLMLSGRVSAGDAGVGSVAVSFTLGGWESTDSLTHTASDGTWNTFMEVPADQAAGTTELRASVGEGSTHKPGSQSVTLTIREPVEITEEPEDTQDPLPTEEATPDATATPTVAETEDAATDEGDGEAGNIARAPSPWSWFLIAVVAVGGTALLVTIALLMRRAMHPGEGTDASDTVFLLGSEDWDEGWEAHGHPDARLEEPTQEIVMPDPDGVEEPPADDVRPKRGLPPED